MAMSHPPSAHSRPLGRVRWRRFALLLVPLLGASLALIGLTASGVLASSISVSGSPFTVTANTLTATGFAQYSSMVKPAGQGSHPVSVSVMRSADLASLCQSVTVPGTGFTLRLTAGGGGTPVHADDLVVASDKLTGDATFHNIVIGQDAGQLPGTAGAYPPPQAGGFGQLAESVKISHLYQHTWLTTAGTFSLPGLHLGFGGVCK